MQEYLLGSSQYRVHRAGRDRANGMKAIVVGTEIEALLYNRLQTTDFCS